MVVVVVVVVVVVCVVVAIGVAVVADVAIGAVVGRCRVLCGFVQLCVVPRVDSGCHCIPYAGTL